MRDDMKNQENQVEGQGEGLGQSREKLQQMGADLMNLIRDSQKKIKTSGAEAARRLGEVQANVWGATETSATGEEKQTSRETLTSRLREQTAKFGSRRGQRPRRSALREAVATYEPEEEVNLARIQRGLETEADRIARETEEDKRWAGLKESLANIEMFKNEQARKASEKLRRHQRAQNVIKRTIRRGLAIAGLTLGLLSTATAGTKTDKFAGRTEPEKVKIEHDSGVAVASESEGEGLKIDLSGGGVATVETGSGTEAGTETEPEGEAQEDEGLRVDLGTTEGELVDMVPVTEMTEAEKKEADGEWETTLAEIEAANAESIGDYEIVENPGMSWEEFVNWTNQLDEDAPFPITIKGEAEQYQVDDNGNLRLTNRTVDDGKIVKG
ncbi:hypothetical protein IJI72_02540 [Candidatus Saccharibacteria bacterium]|nr:hypothetical protein [Candidatus Saccharibacteria bacterium]